VLNLALGASCAAPQNTPLQIHYYQGSVLTKDPWIFEIGPGNVVLVRNAPDSGILATMCPFGDNFVCLKDPLYGFAYPRHRKPGDLRWTFEGEVFEVLREDYSVQIFGCRLEHLLLITSDRIYDHVENGRRRRSQKYVVYSPRTGLVAFGRLIEVSNPDADLDFVLHMSDRIPLFFWLADRVGFGAISPPTSNESICTPIATK
jgi:hypothetical protein